MLDLEGASFAKAATVGDPNLASWLLCILTRRETLLIHMENEEWTREENNFFENLLAILNLDEPKSWEKIAAQVPGKTVEQVQKHYEALVEDLKLIESGSFPLPHYREEKEGFRKEVMGYGEETEGMKKETKVMKKDIREGTEGMRKDDGEGTQVNDHQQRKKGTPWTEDEHRLFLAGLKHYGKGDWRSISRNYIKSRTPTQVASHAQKYFIRRNSSRTKERRRPSIHDITGANGLAHVTRINSNAAELASNNQICIVGHATQGQAPNIQMAGRRAQVYLSGPMSNQYKYNGILENLHPPDHHQSMVSGSYQPSSTMDTMGSDYVHGPSVHSPSNHQSTMHMRRAGPSDSSVSNHQLRMHKRTER